MRLSRSTFPILSLMLAGMTAGCGASGAYDTIGVTQGGNQDIGLAREIIEGGGIPSEDSYTAEGLFSEHDLPLEGEACSQVLCPRAAAALVHPIDVDEERILVQLGFGTVFEAESYTRRDLNLSVALDVSGSMAGEKLSAVKAALHQLVEQLHEGDRLSLVLFDDQSAVALEPTVMDESGRADAAQIISRIQSDGGTNIEAGLGQAYKLVAPSAGSVDVEDRVMLFTDAQPNIGATGIDSFLGMARYYGEAGIGISVFGVGLDLGAELTTEISEVRGGNAFYLADPEAIASVFQDDFDYLVSPVAYDLDVDIVAPAGWVFDRAFGTPLDKPAAAVDFGATTLFLSSRNGGMGVEMVPAQGSLNTEFPLDLGTFELSYETDKGEQVEASLAIAFEGGTHYSAESLGVRSPRADDLGVFRMAGLIDELAALDAGAAACRGEIGFDQAQETAGLAADILAALGEESQSAELTQESQLMSRLAQTLRTSGMSACW